jgi:hypothetical protein
MAKGVPPRCEEFRDRARYEFQFLEREYGFHEEPIPTDQNPYLNQYAVWFASPTTRVVVEGINWGMNARVALGRAGSLTDFENYDLGDLLAIRQPDLAGGISGGQDEQLAQFAKALREVAADVLRGDRSIFPDLAVRVERRRAEFVAGRAAQPPAS